MDNTSILVLGAGELGMSVLRNLARRVDSSSGTTVTVLLRLSSINPEAPSKQRDVAELRSLGVRISATRRRSGPEHNGRNLGKMERGR